MNIWNVDEMKIKKGDFIEIDFVGRIKGINQIFDLTKEDIAKKNNLYSPKIKYEPIVICVGEKQVVSGLDDQLVDKEIGKEYDFEISSETGFGKKDGKLLKIVPAKLFRDHKLKPFPGMQVNFDKMVGTVRAVSGGRIIVDFNHPLAGRDLIYHVEIYKRITDVHDKIRSLLKFYFASDVKFEYKNKELVVDVEIPDTFSLNLVQQIKKAIPDLKEVLFKKKEVNEEKQSPKNK